MRCILLLIAACLPFWSRPAACQVPVQLSSPPEPVVGATSIKPRDQCAIEGSVRNAATGEPVARANIVVQESGQAHRVSTTVSDAAGQFRIGNIDPGPYTMWALRTGFLDQHYGAKRPAQPGIAFTLVPGQSLTGAVMKLTPQGVVTGKVVDENGDAVARAVVQCERIGYDRGKKQLAQSGSTSTDDRGDYRIFGLVPGRYYIAVSHDFPGFQGPPLAIDPEKNYEEGYAPLYYPNARTAESAVPLEVTPGAQLRGIDVTLSKTRGVRLRGQVLSSVTNKPANANVFLVGKESGSTLAHGVDNKGSFELHNVAPGSYFLLAQTYDSKQSAAPVPVDVESANMDGLQITVSAGAGLNGRLLVENNAATNGAVFYVELRTEVGQWFTERENKPVNKDGVFTIPNVTPNAYTVAVHGFKDNLYLKAVRFGDTDVTDARVDFTRGVIPGELTVLVSPAGGQIDGVVQDEKSQPAAGATVVLIPDGGKRAIQRLYKTANTGQDGSFLIKGIPPGEYKLFAWDEMEDGAYQDPGFLKAYESNGESVSIKENGRDNRQLKVIRTDGQN